jgi:hypothetical protein
VFSMAMTAWSAKVWSNAICLSLNSLTSMRRMRITPIVLPAGIRGTFRTLRTPCRARSLPSGYSWFQLAIGDVNRSPV